MKTKKVQLSERALLLRVNRALRAVGRQVRTVRQDALCYSATGRHILVRDGVLVEKFNIDIAAYARSLGLLRDYETVSD